MPPRATAALDRTDAGLGASPGGSPGGTVLFEAVSTPHRSASRRGLIVLGAMLGAASLLPAAMFVWFRAWPVLGFMGAEVPLVLTLLTLHHRRAGRARETVLLTDTHLEVTRDNGRGRREAATLEPYWTRVRLIERPGGVSHLLLRGRGRRVEIGRFLNDPEKRDLAAALEAALRRYRTPVFDNPQLREVPP